MFTRRTLLASGIVVLITVAGTACGTDKDTGANSTTSATSSKQTKAPTASGPKATPSATQQKGAYIVVLSKGAGDNVYELQLIDPSTKQIVQRRPFTYNNSIVAQFQNNYVPAAQRRSAFNNDFTEVGVVEHNEQGNDMVGTISLDPGTEGFHGAIAEATSDPNFSVSHKRGVPVFGPDDRLYYVDSVADKATLMSVDKSGSPREEKDPNKVAYLNGVDKTVYFFPHSSTLQSNYDRLAAYSSDGTYGFRVSANAANIEYGDLDHDKVNKAPIARRAGGVTPNVEPVAYVDKSNYLSVDNKSAATKTSMLYKVTVNGDKLDDPKPLLAATDGEINDPTVLDDKVVFLFKKDGKTSLYEADLNKQDQNPKLVYTFDQPDSTVMNVLDWKQLTVKN